MTNFTKKELNRIKTAAFEEFKKSYSDEEFRKMFAGKNIVTAWKISEGEKVKLTITQYDTQINTNTLEEMGFSERATIEKLFLADRQTKCIEFVGRV